MIRTLVVITALIVGGCASKPQVFLGLYGTYEKKDSEVLQILEQQGLDVARIEVDPPFGITTSTVIHGRGRRVADIASDIAYSLYAKFGDWVSVRPVEVTNHKYSDDFIGIYIADNDYLAQQNAKEMDSIAVVGTNVYEVQGCENYATYLTLGESGEFWLAGISFSDSDIEIQVEYSGEYEISADRLTLIRGSDVHAYSLELVQHVEQEAIKRTKLIPNAKIADKMNPFHCEFIQELDVLVRVQ